MDNLLNADKLLGSLNVDLGEDDYEEPLNILIDSLNKEANLTYLGKLASEYQIKKHLTVEDRFIKSLEVFQIQPYQNLSLLLDCLDQERLIYLIF